MGAVQRVHDLVLPIAEELGVELIDVEHADGVLRVTIDRDGGPDIGVITKLTRRLNVALDETDPLPGRYTLEVSSPGLERPLRTPEHFVRAVGRDVVVKTTPDTEGDRRLTGVLVAADADGITVRNPDTLAERTLGHHEIERARTTFTWGPAPKPGAGTNQRRKKAARS